MGRVVARGKVTATGTEAGGTGIVRVTIPPRGSPGTVVFIERIVVRSDSASASVFTLYEGEHPDFEATLDTTTAGNRAVADEASPPVVSGMASLLAEWTGLAAGAECVAIIRYRIEEIEQAPAASA